MPRVAPVSRVKTQLSYRTYYSNTKDHYQDTTRATTNRRGTVFDSIRFDTQARAFPILPYNLFANSPLPVVVLRRRAPRNRGNARAGPGRVESGRNPRRFPRPDHTRMRIVDRTASPPLHVQYYDRPRRPTGARPRAGYGLRAGRDGVSLPRRLSRGSACVARRAAGAGPLFRVTAPRTTA